MLFILRLLVLCTSNLQGDRTVNQIPGNSSDNTIKWVWGGSEWGEPLFPSLQRALPLYVFVPVSFGDESPLAELLPLLSPCHSLRLDLHHLVASLLQGSTGGGVWNCSEAELKTNVAGRSLSQKLGFLNQHSQGLSSWCAHQNRDC